MGSRRSELQILMQMGLVPGPSPVQPPQASRLNGVLFCESRRGLAMWSNIMPVMPVVPALRVGHLVAEEEGRRGLKEPHVLLDKVNGDCAAQSLVVIPLDSTFAIRPCVMNRPR